MGETHWNAAAELRLAFLETVFDHTNLGISFCDRELRYRWVNQHLAEINGRPPEEHIGRSVREVLPWLTEAVEERLRLVLETGRFTARCLRRRAWRESG